MQEKHKNLPNHKLARQRFKVIILVWLSLLFWATIAFLIASENNILPESVTQSQYPIMIVALALVGLISFLMLGYLQGTGAGKFFFDGINDALEMLLVPVTLKNIRKIRYDLEDFRREVSSQDRILDDAERKKLISHLHKKIEQEAVDVVWSRLIKKAENSVLSANKYSVPADIFLRAEGRISAEMRSLSRRGNLNLVLGISVSIIGIGLLYTFVTDVASGEATGLSFFEELFPRVALVGLIELFAYFFLRLYKETLSEIKYFQNEVTSLQLKSIALQIALSTNDQAALSSLIGALGHAERNTILEKGQSTIELERAKIDASGTKEILRILDGISGRLQNTNATS